MDEDILPEDDSVFGNLSERQNTYSSDALLEDSFSEFTAADATSTPVASRKRTRASCQSGSPASSAPCAALSSPSRITRSSSRALNSTLSSPATNTRSATGGSPCRTTRPTSSASSTKGKEKPASRMKCPKCPSTLANKRNLDVHLRTHIMQGVSSRAPNREQIFHEVPGLIDEVLNEMINEPVIGDISVLCHQYCVDLQKNIKEDVSGEVSELFTFFCDNLCNILKGKKALFPSSITATVYTATNKLLSSKEFMATISGHLSVLCEGEDCTVNLVVGNLVFSLTQKVIVYVIKIMRDSLAVSTVVRKKRSADDINDVEFQQLAYHIGGSIVHGFLWKGRKYSENSATWASFCEVLETKFKRSDDRSNQCSEEIRSHTDQMDLGGLNHLSDAGFDFFLSLFYFLMSLEDEDGSLPPTEEVVNDHVLQNEVLLCLWDVLVGDDLGEIDSLDLLIQITGSAVKVTIKGIMKRRLNDDLRKAYDSVALRSRLAK